ncbi:MAG: biotin transporter BioY [Ruminococcaceae bacterium]|nr:biotin transporter BioY [Oscillospiraceae bacterium]
MKKIGISKMLRISLFSALIAVSAMISIPFPIPVTLQTFAIFLAMFTLGGNGALAAITVYTTLGIVGLPVFAGFGSGIGYLLGASGGFVLAFPVVALVFLLLEAIFGDSDRLKLIYAAVSILIIYVIGSAWFAFVFSGAHGFLAALTVCALPYIPIDAVKIFLAYVASKRLKALIDF